MTHAVSLHEVQPDDLPILFEQQLDPEATRLAAFPARARDAFDAHWEKVLADGTNLVRTIRYQDQVAGHIGAWDQADERLVGYWLGREYWGRGIATAALSQFLRLIPKRPLHARVDRSNGASIRVLEKCGFIICGEDRVCWPDGRQTEELVLILQSMTAESAAL